MLLWRIHVAGNNTMYLGLQVKSPIFCSVFIKSRVSRQVFIKVPNTKFHDIVVAVKTVGRTCQAAFLDYVNAPKRD
jgi:hypothetical protein